MRAFSRVPSLFSGPSLSRDQLLVSDSDVLPCQALVDELCRPWVPLLVAGWIIATEEEDDKV